MSSAVRLFIGVDISVEAANQLRVLAAAARERLADAAASWVAPARYHVTLKYLGWTRVESIFAIRERVTAIAAAAAEYRVRVGGLGAFPSLEKARVLWVGAASEPALDGLAAALDEVAIGLGFEADKRAFHPHVTIARLREPSDVRSALEVDSTASVETRVRFLTLFESDINSDGCGYPAHHRWELAAAKRQTSDLKRRDN